MLGDFLTNALLMLFGYAYPAFECFKTVEKRPVETWQLLFWCQYWIIVAWVTVFEKFGVSWIPMYGEIKLAFFVYLWYPKTRGSDLIYDTFLRPFVMQYEPNIEQRLLNLRAKSGELIMFYLKNFADKGQTVFFEVLQYVVSQGNRTPTPSTTTKIKRPASSQPIRSGVVHGGFTEDEFQEDAVTADSLRGARAKPRKSRFFG